MLPKIYRIEPTTHLNVLGYFLKGDTTEEINSTIANVVESKKTLREFINTPNEDIAPPSIDELYLDNSEERVLLDTAQWEMVAAQKRQNCQDDVLVQVMEIHQANLHRKFQDTNVFLKDCRDKAEIAQREITAEMQKEEKLAQQIAASKAKAEDLQEFRSYLQEEVEKYKPYETLLQEVVDGSHGEYKSKAKLVNECDSLLITQDEIRAMEENTLQEIENMRKAMVSLVSETKLEIMGLKNSLEKIERDLLAAKQNVTKFERLVSLAKDRIAQQTLMKERTYDASFQLARMLMKRRTHFMKNDPMGDLNRTDLGKIMMFIKSECEIMKKTLEDEAEPER